MKKGIQKTLEIFFTFIFFFGVTAISEAGWEGTIGTKFTVNGSGFGIKKPSVYVEYEKKPGIIAKAAVKVESYSNTSLTCLWVKKLPVGTYNLFVKPQVKGSTPVHIDTFSLMNPSINNVSPATGAVGDVITVQGEYFSSKKPNIYLEDPTTLKRKGCKVLKSLMDPITGESSLQFKVPKGAFETYNVILRNQFGDTTMNHEFAQIIETGLASQQYNRQLSSEGDSGALGKTVDWLKTQPGVRDAAIGGDGSSIWVQFENGVESIIQTASFGSSLLVDASISRKHGTSDALHKTMITAITDMSVAENKKKGVILLPVDYNKYIWDNAKYTSDALRISLESARYIVEIKIGKEVSIDFMKTISEYDFIYMFTHGGVRPWSDVNVMTGERITSNNFNKIWEITSGEEGVLLFFPSDSEEIFFSLSPDFFDNYTYRDSFIYMFACSSYKNPSLADAFLNNGAAVYMGFDNYALSDLAPRYDLNFFRELTTPNKTLKEAYDSALAPYFPGDVCKNNAFIPETDKNNGISCENGESSLKNPLNLKYNDGVKADQYRLNTSDTIPPSVPNGLTATAVSSSSINLTWNTSSDTGGSGVAGYHIYRDGNLINGSAANNYLDPGLSPNTQYCYTVSAYDAASNVSAQSSPVCITISSTTLSVSGCWTLFTYDGIENETFEMELAQTGTAIDGKFSAYKDGDLYEWYLFGDINGNSINFVAQGAIYFTGTINGDSMSGTFAIPELQESDTWSAQRIACGDDNIPPSVPTNLSATAVSSSQISLTWDASSDNIGGSGVVGYNIFRNGNLIGGSAVNNYSDPGLSPNTQYCYSVSAFDAASNVSVQSSQVCATTPPFSKVFKLPDTGQTNCYRGVDPYDEIPCTGTGQDGAYNINPLSYTDNGNGIVTDNNTGLIWQKQDDGNTYNWYQATGTYHQQHNLTSQDVCGNLTLGGFTDWRLPSKKELISIVDYGRPYPGPAINRAYFDTTYYPYIYASYYWSSTMVATTGGGYAWSVDFANGIASDRHADDDEFVRCVRGGIYPSQSFIDNIDSTITDNATELMWQKGEPGHMTWGQALSYCEGLTLGGHSDWRLPNVKEIEWITDDSRVSPAIDTNFFPNAERIGVYWSSTTALFSSYYNEVMIVGSEYSYVGVGYSKEYNFPYVRCVRGGQ